ncbi:MAG: response regulator [Pseudomonadota bacterium]
MPRLLLVEDNADNRDLMEAMLGEHFDLSLAADGREALERIEQGPRFDLFLFDISLPEMDGVELLKKIRQLSDYRSVPAIALTSHAMKGDRERFIDKGFDDYISKPILDEADVIKVIHAQLDSR